MDRQVGRIIAALEHAGLADGTIVVFTSDHGDMIGDHGLLEKRAFYEPAVKVPMMVRIPRPGDDRVRVDGNFSQVDLVATLLDLMDQSLPNHLGGQPCCGV